MPESEKRSVCSIFFSMPQEAHFHSKIGALDKKAQVVSVFQ